VGGGGGRGQWRASSPAMRAQILAPNWSPAPASSLPTLPCEILVARSWKDV
jgi:hypothetical protein